MAQSRRSRARRAQKRSEIQAGPGAHAPDLEQLIQERREERFPAGLAYPTLLLVETHNERLCCCTLLFGLFDLGGDLLSICPDGIGSVLVVLEDTYRAPDRRLGYRWCGHGTKP
ncbi:hypothetical protein NDU88_004768 [Pleurodeles waltl]|uniref:Uncharacterized protein n=1 Tax=Pleurodeles waltl TaxID=8319 RepID=A0AAV7SJU6_PLEWA|nr:hypothetical protein NDU88_004768 [Pleurodeles waltl]